MTSNWTDYAEKATARWLALGADLNPTRFSAGIRLERVARSHEYMLNDALIPLRGNGVRGMEDFRLLALLVRLHPESTSATEASKILQISKAATSARVERFVDDGLAVRAVSEHDRRAVAVSASSEGLAVAARCVTEIASVHDRILSGLSAEQTAQLHELLGEITSRFV